MIARIHIRSRTNNNEKKKQRKNETKIMAWRILICETVKISFKELYVKYYMRFWLKLECENMDDCFGMSALLILENGVRMRCENVKSSTITC